MADEFEYAVWYETKYCVDYVEIFRDELAAAKFAAHIDIQTDGLVFGVQRSDGALEPANTWPMFGREKGILREKRDEIIRAARAGKQELVDIINPFTGEKSKYDKGEYPDWVGKK